MLTSSVVSFSLHCQAQAAGDAAPDLEQTLASSGGKEDPESIIILEYEVCKSSRPHSTEATTLQNIGKFEEGNVDDIKPK